MSTTDNNGEHGVAHLEVPVMTITVDPRTMLPSFKSTALPIAFWQMMVEEIGRQLEEQRRIAAAQQLRAVLQQQAADQVIADSLRKR